MPRPVHALVDLSALRANVARVRAAAGGARVLAVAKAAAYGHGLARVLPALAGADGLGLLDLEDAALARAAGWQAPVVLLEGAFEPRDLEEASRLGLDLVLHSEEQWTMIESARLPRPIGLWIKSNTGMNRLGLRPAAFDRVLRAAEASPQVAAITLMTHFACADDGREVAEQAQRFAACCGASPHPRSLANSAALLGHPETRADWVRPGILLWGGSPFGHIPAARLGVRPVMSLRAQLVAVQVLAPGEAVGYGRTFVASSHLRVGIVSCGYADGYPRHAPTGTPVLVDGVRTRTLGRVSMDMLAVDLSPCPGAGPGSAVTLWGEGLPVDEVAAAAGTIGYELLCALAPRVPVHLAGLAPGVAG